MKYSSTLVLIISLFMYGCAKKNQEIDSTKTTYQLALNAMQDYDYNELGYKKALAILEQAPQHNSLTEGLRGTCLFKLHKHDKAKQVFSKALQICDNSMLRAEIENNYACLLAEEGYFVEADALWRALAASTYYLTPEVALVNQAKLNVVRGKLLLAKELLLQATHKAPQFADAWYYLALVAQKTNDAVCMQNALSALKFLERC